MKSIRCDAVVVTIIIAELDEHGRPIGELTSQPTKVFRASTPDFWADVDKAVEAMRKQQAAPPEPSPAPIAAVKGKRR